MAQTFDEKIPFSKDGLEFAGLFKRGQADKPLVVLLHGGGTSAAYFDNSCHSYAPCFSILWRNTDRSQRRERLQRPRIQCPEHQPPQLWWHAHPRDYHPPGRLAAGPHRSDRPRLPREDWRTARHRADRPLARRRPLAGHRCRSRRSTAGSGRQHPGHAALDRASESHPRA